MSDHSLTAVLAAYTTGSHPGPAYYAEWLLIIGAIVGAPIYIVRRVRHRRKRR